MTRAFRSGARPSPTKAMIDDQKKAKVKRAFRSDDAYMFAYAEGYTLNFRFAAAFPLGQSFAIMLFSLL